MRRLVHDARSSSSPSFQNKSALFPSSFRSASICEDGVMAGRAGSQQERALRSSQVLMLGASNPSMHPDACEKILFRTQRTNPGRVCPLQRSVQASGPRSCWRDLGAAGTCAPLTAEFGSTPPSFPPFVIWMGGWGVGRRRRRRLAFTPTRRPKQAGVSVRTSARPLLQPHRCSSWHLGRLRRGGTGGLCGVSGAAGGQRASESA